jgi:hypothetical protein
MRRDCAVMMKTGRDWIGTKTLFSPFAKTKTFTKSVAFSARFRLFFAKGFRENLMKKMKYCRRKNTIAVSFPFTNSTVNNYLKYIIFAKVEKIY